MGPCSDQVCLGWVALAEEGLETDDLVQGRGMPVASGVSPPLLKRKACPEEKFPLLKAWLVS